jgi:hypothetical protein
MGFPFNLFSIDWAAHKDALGNDATLVPEWLAALTDELPLVREEGFEQLEDHLVSGGGVAPIAPFVVEPLLKLIETEQALGRALASVLLANVALCARTQPNAAATELLEQLESERRSLETITTRHDASTPFGAALRGLLAVIAARNASARFVEQLAEVEALVLEADAKDEAPIPTVPQVKRWLEEVKTGEGHALGLAQRAFAIDPAGALAILEADTRRGATSVQQVHRAALRALCCDALDQPVTLPAQTWNRSAQALLLDAAERHCVKAPKVGLALLAAVTDSSHSVRRRAVEVRVEHAAGRRDEAWKLADALAGDWLLPARAGGVNQSLGRDELLGLMKLFGADLAAERVAQLRAAARPEVALPDGDSL